MITQINGNVIDKKAYRQRVTNIVNFLSGGTTEGNTYK